MKVMLMKIFDFTVATGCPIILMNTNHNILLLRFLSENSRKFMILYIYERRSFDWQEMKRGHWCDVVIVFASVLKITCADATFTKK